MRSSALLKLGVPLACGAVVALAASALADSPQPARSSRRIDATRALDAGALAPSTEVVIGRAPPDPPPLVERSQWIFDLQWDRGDVWLLGVSPTELPAPQATPRVMGRFALELFEGPTLIERVRFDFPLLGGPEPADAGWAAPPSLTRMLRSRVGVVFPATHRGTRLELLDRARNRRWTVPWPPTAAADAAP